MINRVMEKSDIDALIDQPLSDYLVKAATQHAHDVGDPHTLRHLDSELCDVAVSARNNQPIKKNSLPPNLEWAAVKTGHLAGQQNMPLALLTSKMHRLKLDLLTSLQDQASAA